MDWEFGVNRCKLLPFEWISNEILLYPCFLRGGPGRAGRRGQDAAVVRTHALEKEAGPGPALRCVFPGPRADLSVLPLPFPRPIRARICPEPRRARLLPPRAHRRASLPPLLPPHWGVGSLREGRGWDLSPPRRAQHAPGTRASEGGRKAAEGPPRAKKFSQLAGPSRAAPCSGPPGRPLWVL